MDHRYQNAIQFYKGVRVGDGLIAATFRARSAHMGGIYWVYGVNDIFFYKYMIRNAILASSER